MCYMLMENQTHTCRAWQCKRCCHLILDMKTGSYFEVPCLLILSPSAAAVWHAAAEGELKGIKNKIKFLFEAVTVLKKGKKKIEKSGPGWESSLRSRGFLFYFYFFSSVFRQGNLMQRKCWCYATCKVKNFRVKIVQTMWHLWCHKGHKVSRLAFSRWLGIFFSEEGPDKGSLMAIN